MRLFLISLCITFYTLSVNSQNKLFDSLWPIYNNQSLNDTVRLQAIHDIAWNYRNNNPDTAIILATKELEFSNRINSIKGKYWSANALRTIGVAYKNKGDYKKAIEKYKSSLQLFETIRDKKGIAACYGSIGLAYQYLSDYPLSLSNNLKGLKIFEEIDNKQGIGTSLSNIGNVYLFQSNFPKALEYYFKALTIRETIQDLQGVGDCYNNIGAIYKEQKNTLKSLEFYLKAMKSYEAIGNKKGVGGCYNNIGTIYEEQRKYSDALSNYLKSLSISREIDDKQAIGYSYVNIADLYNILGNNKLVLQYTDSALMVSKEIHDINAERTAYEVLAYTFYKTRKYKEAYDYHVKFKKLTDSIFNTENSQLLGDLKTNFEVEKKEVELKIKSEAKHERLKALSNEEKKRQRIIIYSVVGILLLVIMFSFFLYKRFRITQQQKKVIESQKHLVEEKQKEIIESITYAKRLQEAILPPQVFIDEYLPQNFILYKPKDLVAGDFYWAEKINGLFFIAAADSTGHGVPGAMVSVVCSNALNRSVKEFNLTETGKILDKTRALVLETFEKSTNEVKDGMDISLLCIDFKNKVAFWSGANNPLWYIQNNLLTEIKADKQPIGKTEYPKPFTTHQITFFENTTFYLFTDGLADQFGGPNGKKFKYKQFSNLLLQHHQSPPKQQIDIIDSTLSEWKGDLEQVDDICVIGIKI